MPVIAVGPVIAVVPSSGWLDAWCLSERVGAVGGSINQAAARVSLPAAIQTYTLSAYRVLAEVESALA